MNSTVTNTFVSLSGGRLTVTSSHTPGSVFPVGETLVQYIATDAAGNSRTCNLTITVQGANFSSAVYSVKHLHLKKMLLCCKLL